MKGNCPTCKVSLEGIKCGGIGKVWFCLPCYEQHSKKRLYRMDRDLLGKPFLAKRAQEFRQAKAEVEELKKEADSIRNKYRQEVYAEMNQLSWWGKLMIVLGYKLLGARSRNEVV